MVSRCAPQFRREPAHAPRARRCRGRAGVPRRGQACAPRLPRGAGRGGVAGRRCAAGAGREGRRPRRRVPAQHAGGDHRDARCDEPGRGLVVVFPRFRRAGCARPLRPDRAAHPLHHRWLLVQRQGPADRGQGRRDRHEAAVGRARRRRPVSRIDGAGRAEARVDPQCRPLGRFSVRARCRADRLRAPAVRPPALHPLLVGDDRRAEVHRPRCGRHAAAAPQGARAARRHQGRRPPVLFHDLRLDDVELARVGPCRGCDAAALRRLAVHRSRQGALGLRRGRADHPLRHVGEVHRPRQEDRRRSVQGLRALGTCGRCSRREARSRPRASTTSTSA